VGGSRLGGPEARSTDSMLGAVSERSRPLRPAHQVTLFHGTGSSARSPGGRKRGRRCRRGRSRRRSGVRRPSLERGLVAADRKSKPLAMERLRLEDGARREPAPRGMKRDCHRGAGLIGRPRRRSRSRSRRRGERVTKGRALSGAPAEPGIGEHPRPRCRQAAAARAAYADPSNRRALHSARRRALR